MSTDVTFEPISEDESWAIFDENARRLLGISGGEFAARWDNGDFQPVTDSKVVQLVMLRPSGG